MHRYAVLAAIILSASACGSNNESNNAATNNGTANNGTTPTNNASNNTTTNNETNAGTSNNTTAGNNGMMAGEGELTFTVVVNGTEASETCVEDADFGAVDQLGAGYAGDQANISCPSVTSAALANPSAFIALKDYKSLPAAFSFTEADAGTEFELAGDAGGMGSAESLSHNTATAVTLTGTWDAATRQLTGAFDATFEARDGFGGGTMEGAFNVTLPE